MQPFGLDETWQKLPFSLSIHTQYLSGASLISVERYIVATSFYERKIAKIILVADPLFASIA